MNQPRLVCLSLTPNLRCVGFTVEQFIALVIPPAIEAMISSLFIYLYSGPSRRAQLFLTLDSILYFIWALLDTLSHVVPKARVSLSVFKALDFFVGAVSFTPILVYSLYLYRLSFRDSIPALPRKVRSYLETSLPILLVIAVIINEVSSFVGTYLDVSSNEPIVIMFSNHSESLWLSLSQSSLTIYTIIQFLFFLLAFSRLSREFFNQRRIDLISSDEHVYGIAWITAGIIIGVVETIAGFSQVSFGVALARRILRLIARATLVFGLLKGHDDAESFDSLADEPAGLPRTCKRVLRMLGINLLQQTDSFHSIPHSSSEQSRADTYSSAEKGARRQRVTVHCEKGQPPFLQIRFSTLDFPAQAVLPDMVQSRRRSLSGLIPGHTNASGNEQQPRENILDVGTRNAMLNTRRVKSALVTGDDHHVPPDWIWPPKNFRRASGETISDSLSIVRELERKFPNLPPRVTGKYRGSILGQNYEEDLFPVVGVSRQSSLRQDGNGQSPNEDGGTSVTLSPSGSIRRKPAPPLLENIVHISDKSKRPVSTWKGFTQNITALVDSPVTPNSPYGAVSASSDGPDPTQSGEPSTLRSTRMSTRDLIKRAGRALSDASIRSAEWLASASSPRSSRTPLTVADIEMYRRGNLGPRSTRPATWVGEAPSPGDSLLPKSR